MQLKLKITLLVLSQKILGGGVGSYKPLTYSFSAVPKPSDAIDANALKYSIIEGNKSNIILDVYNKSITFSNIGSYILRIANESGKVYKDILFDVSDGSEPILPKRDNPLTVFGKYKVNLYSFDGSTPSLNPAGDAELYISSRGVELLLNGGIFIINSESIQELVDSANSSIQIAEKVLESMTIAGEAASEEGVIRADTILTISPMAIHAETLADSNGIESVSKVLLNITPFVTDCGYIPANNLKNNSGDSLILDGQKNQFTSQLSLNVEPFNAVNKELIYTSSDEDIVKVTSSGLIRAIKNGKATVSVSLKGANSIAPITYSIEVKNRFAERIGFIDKDGKEIKELSVKVGEAYPLKAIVMPRLKEYEDIKIEYRGTNVTVASIDKNNGSLKANREGKVTISAYNEEFEKIYLPITVLPADYSSDNIHGVLAISNVPSVVYIAADGTYDFNRIAPFPKDSLEDNECVKILDNGTKVYSECFTYNLFADYDTDIDSSNYILLNKSNGTLSGKKYELERNSFTLTISPKDSKFDVSEDVQVFIEEDVVAIEINAPKQVYVGTGNPINNEEFKGKNDSSFYITASPLPEGAKSNTDFHATVKDKNMAEITPAPNAEYKNRWKVTPKKEGNIEINVAAKNGVQDNVTIVSKEVINIHGYYRVTDVGYKENANATKFKWFKVNNDATTKKIEGEFAIYLDNEGKKIAGVPQAYISGRVQFTPAKPKEDYAFNELRYQYFTKEHMLDPADQYAMLTREALASNNIFVDNSTESSLQNRLVIVTEDSRGNEARIYIQKKSDYLGNLDTVENIRVIKDYTIYVTPVDFVNDLYSIRGYYHLDHFFHNSYGGSWVSLCVQPNYSHECNYSRNGTGSNGRISAHYQSEMNSYSGGFKFKRCDQRTSDGCFLGICAPACEGGSGSDHGSVKWFKGESSIFLDMEEGTSNGEVYAQHKVQYHESSWKGLIGKAVNGLAGAKWLSYMYVATRGEGQRGNNRNGPIILNLKTFGNDNVQRYPADMKYSGAEYFKKSNVGSQSLFHYRKLPNNFLVELKLDLGSITETITGDSNAGLYHQWKPLEGSWSHSKVSDRPSELPDSLYDNVNNRNKPSIPELSIRKDLSTQSGQMTPLHF